LAAVIRIHLTGALALQHGGSTMGSESFPGHQGRLAFALLALEHRRPVLRDELSTALWADDPPMASDGALKAIVSKLRAGLRRAGLSDSLLSSGLGYYQLQLPAGTWIDVETAIDSLHQAEAAVRLGDTASAYGPATVAFHITRRPFLAGEHGPWVDQWRGRLRDVRVRGLECLAQVYISNGEPSIAVDLCHQSISIEPFRETGYQLLMRAHAATGNRAEALRVYEHCRKLLSEELGADPSSETQTVHLNILNGL
jgi:SARP family transcriptional regulator, regulator of embCAB operon